MGRCHLLCEAYKEGLDFVFPTGTIRTIIIMTAAQILHLHTLAQAPLVSFIFALILFSLTKGRKLNTKVGLNHHIPALRETYTRLAQHPPPQTFRALPQNLGNENLGCNLI